MHGDDQKDQQPKINMSARPALNRSEMGSVPSLPNAQEHQHEDPNEAEPTIDEAACRTARGNGVSAVKVVSSDEGYTCGNTKLQVTFVVICQ